MEKRNNTRILFDVSAVLRFKDKTIECRVVNLSLQGALLQTDETLPLDEIINIEIFMEGTTSQLNIGMEGKVARVDESETAIEFNSIDFDSFVHLKNIISYNEGNEQKIMDEFYKQVKTTDQK